MEPIKVKELPIEYNIDKELLRLIAEANEKYGEYVNALQNGTCIDIPHVTVNKTQGLLRVAEHFGVPRENVIAVGDNVNDTDMIRDFYSRKRRFGGLDKNTNKKD